jgi:multidrug resistance efflux pump
MLDTFRHLAAAAVAVAFTIALGALHPAAAQTAVKQIQLTEKQVEAFIAAQKKITAAKADAELEGIAKQHGFASLDELDDVEANILLVMDGIDPDSKAFAEPPVQIKRRIEAVTSDKSMPEADRKQALAELNESLKSAQPIQFRSNIDLVKKYYDRLRAVLQQP